MALTDYISPVILREEGYVNRADDQEMFENIDKDFLKQQGWFDLSALKDVPLSVNMASHVIGVHPTTLMSYVTMGAIETDETGHISFLDALKFDYPKAKENLMKSKTHITNKNRRRCKRTTPNK